MPTPTWTPMANITLSSSASSITFSNIPNTYRDLILVISVISSSAGTSTKININSDTGNNYSYVRMVGDTGSATSSSGTLSYLFVGDNNTAIRSSIVQFMDYSATDKHKTILARYAGRGDNVQAIANRWANTNAVSSMVIAPLSGTWSSTSTFALYGVIA